MRERAIVLAIAGAALLAACGNQKDAADTRSPAPAAPASSQGGITPPAAGDRAKADADAAVAKTRADDKANPTTTSSSPAPHEHGGLPGLADAPKGDAKDEKK